MLKEKNMTKTPLGSSFMKEELFILGELTHNDRIAEDFVTRAISSLVLSMSIEAMESCGILVTVSIKPKEGVSKKKATDIAIKEIIRTTQTRTILFTGQHTLLDFISNKYLHHDKPIHLTSSEILFLLRVLVYKERPEEVCRGMTSKLRRKFGEDFLLGVL